MANKFFDREWWKAFVVAILATTVSIVFTFGSAAIVNRSKQKKERRLTALMVMSNIESFARELEATAVDLASIDSAATWLLQVPIDDVAKLGNAPFNEPFSIVFGIPFLRHDRTAETIFSSNIDTWKNMGNFKFIDNVGTCFSQMNWMEEFYNDAVTEIVSAKNRISNNPKEYTGNSMAEKYLRDEYFRRKLLKPNSLRGWLLWNAAQVRELNHQNMQLIGITEEEVMKFTDDLGNVTVEEEEELNQLDFNIPRPHKDSLDKYLPYAQPIDSLLRLDE